MHIIIFKILSFRPVSIVGGQIYVITTMTKEKHARLFCHYTNIVYLLSSCYRKIESCLEGQQPIGRNQKWWKIDTNNFIETWKNQTPHDIEIVSTAWLITVIIISGDQKILQGSHAIKRFKSTFSSIKLLALQSCHYRSLSLLHK